MRRWAIAAALAAAAAIITVIVLKVWKTDDDLIRASIERFVVSVSVKEGDNPISRMARIKSTFAETVEEDVHVSVEELGIEVSGRKPLADEAGKLGMVYQRAKADVIRVDIKREPSAFVATADATVRVVGTRGGSERQDLREVHFLLGKQDGAWRIRGVDVHPERAR